MNILSVLASPRNQGNTAILLKEYLNKKIVLLITYGVQISKNEQSKKAAHTFGADILQILIRRCFKMVTIVFAHPWQGSFNKAILDTVTTVLEQKKKEYQVIDLNKENFNPVMTEGELALYSKGQHKDPLVTKYQNILEKTDEIIFIFPIWWYDTPAILKGFLDKVMLKNFAYTESSTGLKGKLTHIKSAKVITTAQSPRWYLKYFAGNLIQKTFINTTLKGIGIKSAKWLHCGDVSKGAQVKREKFLQKLTMNI